MQTSRVEGMEKGEEGAFREIVNALASKERYRVETSSGVGMPIDRTATGLITCFPCLLPPSTLSKR